MSDLLARLKVALESRYAIDRELGAGGMATVYLAEDVKHRRKVAVKVLRPELAASLGPTRFLREIEIAAQLQHPHILPLLDSGEADGFLYYVMPYIDGVSLRDRLTRQGELPVAEATRLLRDVADALSYAHGRGVVHRDIKPDNVMLSGRHALVMDFGVAKAVSEATGRQNLTTIGVALGTPAYMAPEQAAADPNVDHRADIYALGVMGYELLTGRPPFTGLTPQQVLAAHVTEAPKPVAEQRTACPPALAETVMRCLAKRPADRWQSADEIVERLEALGTPSGGTTPTQTQPTQAVRIEDRWYGHPARVASLFGVVALAVLGVVYFLTIQLGLPDWVPWGAVALLGAGLPIMIVTGLVERRRAKAKQTGVYSPSGETGSPGLDHLAEGDPGRHGGLLGARRRGRRLHRDAAARHRAGGNAGGLGQALGAGQADRRRLRQQGRGYHARRFADRGVPHRLGSITGDLRDEHLRGECGAQPDESRSGQDPGCDHRPGTGAARGGQGHRRRRDQPGREGLRALRPGALGDRRERAGGAPGNR